MSKAEPLPDLIARLRPRPVNHANLWVPVLLDDLARLLDIAEAALGMHGNGQDCMYPGCPLCRALYGLGPKEETT